ncbi:MAG: FG-GAP-like repeat-containing protein [Bacteroidota bacterium]
MLSKEGPALATGDVNGDGLPDIYLGGAIGQTGQLLLQTANGDFAPTSVEIFMQYKNSEDISAVFFDADGDQDLDLYVVSGGNEFKNGDERLQDRLFINGNGNWTDGTQQLPILRSVGSCVKPADYDQDGDLDLFVGTRVIPNFYGNPPKSFLLQNQGDGTFKDLTVKQFPDLRKLGMVTDAEWTDLENDGSIELVVTGEWMPIKVFSFQADRFVEQDFPAFQQNNGWWYSLEIADLNGDQNPDIIAGNLGLNAMFKASESEPFEMYVKDFDQNGSIEQIFVNYRDGQPNPIALRNELGKQLTAIKKKFVDFKSYADKSLYQVFTKEELEGADHFQVRSFESQVFLNQGSDFKAIVLPEAAQRSPIRAIISADVDEDGNTDLIIGGNFSYAKPEIGRYAASYGLTLKGNGDGTFTVLNSGESGIQCRGDIRGMTTWAQEGQMHVLIARNNDHPMLYSTK